jgi:hypothetical protein
MSQIPAAGDTALDKTVVGFHAAVLVVLYIFLFRVVEGSWSNMLHNTVRLVTPIVVYFALVAGMAVTGTRRKVNLKRWWFLLLLPVCGALAAIAGRAVEPGSGSVMPAVVTGVWYGALHALFLWWSWRGARRAGAASA